MKFTSSFQNRFGMRKAWLAEIEASLTTLCDMHSHILPGMDDGPRHMEIAGAMARDAWGQGISTIIATPHLDIEQIPPDRFRQRRDERLASLQQQLDEAGVPVRLLRGAEIALSASLPACIRETGLDLFLKTAGLAGSHRILVEFPFYAEPVWAEDILFQLSLLGLEPVIAHPERTAWLTRDTERLAGMVHRGCRIQLNAESLLPGAVRLMARMADSFVKADLVHLVGSDAHSTGYRRCRLREALVRTACRFGRDKAVRLAENGRRLAESVDAEIEA
jgi:protein-tyrosine phosphatase